MENILSVSVLVFQDENILFAKSNNDRHGIKLTLPSGKLKDNETIEECAVREVEEAAGIKVVLDKKLSGVITRRNKQGNYLVTFVFLAETSESVRTSSAVYVPYKDVKYYKEISDFSKLIIEKLKVSTLSGLDSNQVKGGDGRDYLMYF